MMKTSMPTLRLLALVASLLLPVLAAAQTPAVAPQSTPAVTSPEAAKALVDILKDDTARAVLIGELERLATPAAEAASPAPAQATGSVPAAAAPATAAAPTTAAEPATPAQPAVPLAREIGSVTQDLSRQVVDVVMKTGRGLANLASVVDGSADVDWDGVREQGFSLFVVIVFAFATLTIFRFIARYPVNALAHAATGKSLPRRLPFCAAALVANWMAIGLAWFATSAFAIAMAGTGRIGLLPSLFIDAFVLIEFVKSCLFAVFEFRRPDLRIFPLEAATARVWYLWLSRLIGFLGYGVMVAHPVVNKAVGFSVGIGFRLAVVLMTLIGAIALVTVKRDEVRVALFRLIEPVKSSVARTLLALLAHGWHVVVIVYLVVAFVLWVSRPFDALDYMAWATVETVVAIGFGSLVDGLIARAIADGVRLPADVKRTLPLLEARLNMMVPMFFRAVRMLLVATVVAMVAESWGIIDIPAIVQSEGGTDAIGRVLSALIILLIAGGIWLATSSYVEYRLNPTLGRITNARTRTLLSLFRNAFSIVLIVIAAMLTLSQLGVDIAPLIAGAGVVGLAVGFGSQKLVQDIITGAFIQFENAMNEGDVVTVAGISGVVDRLTIRSVAIRDADGVYHIIPFSSVSSVSNAMRGFAFHVAVIDVAYKEDIGAVKEAMQEAFRQLMDGPRGSVILEPLDMHGVIAFAPSGVTVRARIKTLPGEQWATGRLYNELLKQVFDERGIEIPFPQTKVWFGTEAEAPKTIRPVATAGTPANDPGDRSTPADRLDGDDDR